MVKKETKLSKGLKIAGAVGIAALTVSAAGIIGASRVDITSDNAAVIADAVAKVDITTDNAAAIAAAMPDVEAIKNASFAEGAASVKVVEDLSDDLIASKERLDSVLEFLQEELNNKEIFDVDEDELDLIVENVLFRVDAGAMAEALVKAEGEEYIDDENVFTNGLTDYRDSDIYIFNLDEDETKVNVQDYEDKEAIVKVVTKVKLDNDDDKTTEYVKFTVTIEDGVAEIVNAKIM